MKKKYSNEELERAIDTIKSTNFSDLKVECSFVVAELLDTRRKLAELRERTRWQKWILAPQDNKQYWLYWKTEKAMRLATFKIFSGFLSELSVEYHGFDYISSTPSEKPEPPEVTE